MGAGQRIDIPLSEIIFIDIFAGGIELDLPAASSGRRWEVWVRPSAAGNNVVVHRASPSDTFGGIDQPLLTFMNFEGMFTIVQDGINSNQFLSHPAVGISFRSNH